MTERDYYVSKVITSNIFSFYAIFFIITYKTDLYRISRNARKYIKLYRTRKVLNKFIKLVSKTKIFNL